MQIEIDFEVFKALTALRENESDTYNHVIRRLLNLAPPAEPKTLGDLLAMAPRKSQGLLAVADEALPALASKGLIGAISEAVGGAWFNGVHLPDGTKLRASYKGKSHFAEIREGQWVDSDGVVRTSPSDAASAISNTNVNGWRFWRALLPGATQWHRLDELRP